MEKTKIDTQNYKSLYPYQDRKKYGRYRELPDIEFKPEVKRMIERIESGEVDSENKNVFNN